LQNQINKKQEPRDTSKFGNPKLKSEVQSMNSAQADSNSSQIPNWVFLITNWWNPDREGSCRNQAAAQRFKIDYHGHRWNTKNI